jgi:hypothetical protein
MTGWSVTSAQQGDGEHQGDRACASVAPCPHGSAHEVLNSPLWQLLDTPVLNMDCIEAMAAMPQASVDAIVCDPPYGLEFMGSAWDRLDWRDGGGFSKTGLGDRPTEWTSYGAETADHVVPNLRRSAMRGEAVRVQSTRLARRGRGLRSGSALAAKRTADAGVA